MKVIVLGMLALSGGMLLAEIDRRLEACAPYFKGAGK